MSAPSDLLVENAVLRSELDAKARAVAERDQEIARLRHNLEVLRKMLFGPQSEKRGAPVSDAAGQQMLALGEVAAQAERSAQQTGATATVDVQPAAKKPKKAGRRTTFPEHLPVVRETVELVEEARTCVCGHALKRIGEEVTRELERVEVTVVHEIARAKYACPSCREHVVTAPAPSRVIDKGLLGTGFLAYVVSERFGNHMPYHRIEQKLADEGLSLSRSVLCTSAGRCADLLEPVVEQMKAEILAGPFAGADDTRVSLQKGSDGESGDAYLWLYRDLEGRCVYDFTERRNSKGPAKFLEGFKGFVQADAANLYDSLFGPEGPTEVGCMAHARRKFVDAESTDPTLAQEAVTQFAALYAVEKEATERGLCADERRALRQEKAAPALAELFSWMERTHDFVLEQSPLGQAVGYALRNRVALSRYLGDGRLPVDNNAVERGLRRVALGRNNWVNIGNEEGGRRAAVLYSLVQSCREIGVNPTEYLRDVLVRIATCSDPAKLTPHGWKQHFMAEVHAQRRQALSRVTLAPR
jgi:transposase